MASIARLRPRVGSFDRALTSFHQGDLRACVSDLHGRSEVAARHLLARVYLRMGSPTLALEAIDLPLIGTDLQMAERETLRIAAHTRLGNREAVEVAVATARAYTCGSASVAQEAEFDFYVAHAAYLLDADGEELEDAAYRILAKSPNDREAYTIPLEHTRVRAYEALQFLEVRAGLFRPVFALAALEELRTAPVHDDFLAANSLMILAGFASNLDQRDLAETVAAKYAAAKWTESTFRHRQTIVAHLGWCAALRGDDVSAFAWFRLAAEHARAAIDFLEVAVHRGHLAAELGGGAVAHEELAYAATLARSIDWAELGERRSILPALAIATASRAPADARWALERYRSLQGDQLSLGSADPRMAVELHQADGRIAAAEGRTAAAIASLSQAHEIAERIGFRWRAHSAAIELAELGAGERFRAFAAVESLVRPRSWLARRTAALAA